MDDHVSSELYEEDNYFTEITPTFDSKNIVSTFAYKDVSHFPKQDSDGDLEVVRKNEYNNLIEIEHSQSTALNLVGLQIWRGALLLADWLIYNNESLPSGYILELGSGVGLTSIIAAKYRPVVCTDIDVGNLLDLIHSNIRRNLKVTKYPVEVKSLDFTAEFTSDIQALLSQVQLIIAADVIYDDRLTDAFVSTVEKLLSTSPDKTVVTALEKRYVFTVTDLETCAPCYEHFKQCLQKLKDVHVQELSIDFPQYFKYVRVKELVLLKIQKRNVN